MIIKSSHVCVHLGGRVPGVGHHRAQHGGELRTLLRLRHPLRGRRLCPQTSYVRDQVDIIYIYYYQGVPK